jgi:hypothetical protein
MIAPIATVVCAIAMALSLSVEADSFFHTPTKATAAPNDAEPAASADGADGTVDVSDEATLVP